MKRGVFHTQAQREGRTGLNIRRSNTSSSRQRLRDKINNDGVMVRQWASRMNETIDRLRTSACNAGEGINNLVLGQGAKPAPDEPIEAQPDATSGSGEFPDHQLLGKSRDIIGVLDDFHGLDIGGLFVVEIAVPIAPLLKKLKE